MTGSVGSDTDVDYYEITVPAGDLAGGYYQASITGVGAGLLVHAEVYTASDNERIHQATPATAGASLFFYWAAAAGQKYGIAVSRSRTLSLPNNYTLQILYTKINDAFEPNDTSGGDAPKLVTAGVPVTAYFFAGFKTRLIDAAEYQDWFALDLPAGMNTITLANVASNWRPMITLMDDMGNPLAAARVIASIAGAGINKPFMVTTPGRYRALIEGYGNQGIVGGGHGSAMTVPDNFTKPYTFTVSQP